jgi:predicted regulator of amino acid metabolism with ACT domain
MIGVVGVALGEALISIASMSVGQTKDSSTALMAIATDRPVAEDVVESLRSKDGILAVHQVTKG